MINEPRTIEGTRLAHICARRLWPGQRIKKRGIFPDAWRGTVVNVLFHIGCLVVVRTDTHATETVDPLDLERA